MQMAICLQGNAAVRACFNDGEAVESSSPVRRCMGFQGFDDEPLVGISLADLRPTHVVFLSSDSWYPERLTVTVEFQGVSTALPARASAASAWGSQNVISLARYNSVAVDSAARACCRWPVLVYRVPRPRWR